MKVCVVGTGYVGLVAGTCFAECGNDVIGVDVDENKLALLREGKSPIYEPGLEELLRRNQKEGRLSFSNDLAAAVQRSLFCFIAVGTPERADGSADLSAVLGVASTIGRAMDGYRIIVNKSTVPVGTAARVRQAVASATSHPFDVVSNPEFLKEGAAIDDFMKPDRVVIGSDSPKAIGLMQELYAPFVRTENPILVMDNPSAEMTKYAANALLATRISFMNEVANLCERVGADVNLVRRGVGSDRRIGQHFLFPGIGYGGSCFPKDVQAMIHTAEEYGLDSAMLRAVDAVNDRQKHVLVHKLKARFGENLRGRTFAIWGLSFKPRTDDMREAPSVTVVEGLLKAGAKVQVHDPEALREARHYFDDRVSYHEINYEALESADALLILTEWNEFRRPDFARMKKLLRQPVIFDGRNLYDPDDMLELGFVYHSVGRAAVGEPRTDEGLAAAKRAR
ncbi:MAG TPA: UDP-glucose/GDP-mannose dehydrogenase family protein [Candidatus Binatia bacterium]|nr:UDP-glucose/GDP-mannose dehydrogenase family protein [Candidatus Binatia bacterium]